MATGQQPTTPPPGNSRARLPLLSRPTRLPATAGGGRPAAVLDELQDRWRRALADLDNLRKRHAKELERVRDEERARTAAAWLPVVDNLERALAHADSDPTAVLKGIEAVRDQAIEVLRGLGYPRYEETGVPFDPTRHEVVGVVDTPDAEPNTVAQVVSPGYGANGRQLRPAFVVVSKRQE